MVGLPRANSNILVKFCIKLGNTASFFLGGGGGGAECLCTLHYQQVAQVQCAQRKQQKEAYVTYWLV